MKGELKHTKDELEQAQNELSTWKFRPDRETNHTPTQPFAESPTIRKWWWDSQILVSMPRLKFLSPLHP